MKTLIIKIKNNKQLVRWDPNKKPQVASGGNLFLLIGVEPIVSPFCSPIDSQLPQLRIRLCPTQKKNGSATPILFFLFGGVLVIGRRIKPYILGASRFAGKNTSTCLRGSPDSSESHRISLLKIFSNMFHSCSLILAIFPTFLATSQFLLLSPHRGWQFHVSSCLCCRYCTTCLWYYSVVH